MALSKVFAPGLSDIQPPTEMHTVTPLACAVGMTVPDNQPWLSGPVKPPVEFGTAKATLMWVSLLY
jgi:hypothetical protein